jgi:hypothetical protein
MKSWLKLFLSILVVYAFIAFMPKILLSFQSYQDILKSSEKAGIDNNSIFYSDEPISYKAEKEIKQKLEKHYEK